MIRFSRHEDALIEKLRLLEFTQSHIGDRFMRGFQDSMNAQHVPEERLPDGMMAALQVDTLKIAEPIYVSHDVTELVDRARETFTPETLLPGDPWTPNGFALFPRPILLDDAPVTEANALRSPNGIIPVRAMAWMAVHSEDLSEGCFWISFYNHVEDEIAVGRRPDSEETEAVKRAIPFTVGHVWQWSWGRNPVEMRAQLVEGEDPDVSEARARQQAAFVQSFWRLGQQFVPAKQRVPRGLWRDSRRKGVEHRDVSVMLLRRSRDAYEHEPTGRQINIRFVVRGHWRNQPYPSLGEGVTRQIWIAPYVKGPEGAELVLTDRAWEFRR